MGREAGKDACVRKVRGLPGEMIRSWPLGLAPAVLVTESSILAQNERWRRVLSMQVERMRTLGCEEAADG